MVRQRGRERRDGCAGVAMSEDITRGLPADLASVLRDQSVVVSQDAAVFELIAAWTKAPAMTASADIERCESCGCFLRRDKACSACR
jgi:hypothetical protein